MASALEIVYQINQFGSFLIYLPFILALKYYMQTKIKDYLLLGIFFLVAILIPFLQLYDFQTDPVTFKYSYIGDTILLFVMTIIFIRIKWETPPQWARGLQYLIIVFGLINILLPQSAFWNGWYIFQYIYNPFNIMMNIFFIYTIVTTGVVVEYSMRANIARILWFLHFTFGMIKHIIVFYGVLNWSIYETPLGLFNAVAIVFMLEGTMFLLLHIFLPEAVIFSKEQVIRALSLYKQIDTEVSPINVGISSINKYLLEAKSFVEGMKQEV